MKHYYRKTRTGKEITFTYSEEDEAFVQKHRSSFKYDREGYVVFSRKQRRFHREIMNPPSDMVVDHIDRDILNCTRVNLRITTRSVNSFNRKRNPGAVNKYPGVREIKLKDSSTFEMEFWVGGERIYRKCYNTFIEAVQAKQALEIIYYGNTYDDIDKIR